MAKDKKNQQTTKEAKAAPINNQQTTSQEEKAVPIVPKLLSLSDYYRHSDMAERSYAVYSQLYGDKQKTVREWNVFFDKKGLKIKYNG